MITTTCDAPECKSYHRCHPTAGSIDIELKRWGWSWHGDGPSRKHYCSIHSKQFVELPVRTAEVSRVLDE